MPFLGQPVIYTARLGEGSGGQLQMPGIVTRVNSDTDVNLFVIPDGGEPRALNNVWRRDVDDFNCWEPLAADAKIDDPQTLEFAVHQLTIACDQLMGRMAAAEAELARRRGGRPPKAEAA